MSEDLKRANEKFRELFDKLIKNDKVTKEQEAVLYIFFMCGFQAGSGETQVVA